MLSYSPHCEAQNLFMKNHATSERLPHWLHTISQVLEQVVAGKEDTGSVVEPLLECFRHNQVPSHWALGGWGPLCHVEDTTLEGWLVRLNAATSQLTNWHIECVLPRSLEWSAAETKPGGCH